MSQASFPDLLVLCRPGFENDCLQELQSHRPSQGKPHIASGWLSLNRPGFNCNADLERQLVFARAVRPISLRVELPERDRLTPILEAMQGHHWQFEEIWLEYPDTNEGKAVSSFCRKFQPYLERACEERGWLRPSEHPRQRLHLFFPSTGEVLIGVRPAQEGDWLCGIPRLRMPTEAPSRSTLKLLEALLVLVDDKARRIKPGMSGVDLGAAPGGWTYQLVQHGLKVFAVDNGPMKGSMDGHPQVKHLREDGFRYRPRHAVDWLVCDMVEQPIRIAKLMAQWLAEGRCRQAIFNFKLPMKKRHAELQKCLDLLENELDLAGLRYRIRCRQLYHDREEVTCYVRVGKD